MGEESINTSGLIIDKIQSDIQVSDKTYKELRNENLEKIKEHHNQVLDSYNKYYTEYQAKINSDNENNKGEANTRLINILNDFNLQMDKNIYKKMEEINQDSEDIKKELNEKTDELSDDNIDELRIKFEAAIEQKEINIKRYKNQYQYLNQDIQKGKKRYQMLNKINYGIMGFVGLSLIYLLFSPLVQEKLKKRSQKQEEKNLFGDKTNNNNTKNSKNSKNAKNSKNSKNRQLNSLFN